MSIIHHLFRSHSRPTPEVVIGLHCSASSSRQWDGYSQLLPPGMHLVAPELIGYGSLESWTPGTPSASKARPAGWARCCFRHPVELTSWVIPTAALSRCRSPYAGPIASRR
jgi:hypothetical protein